MLDATCSEMFALLLINVTSALPTAAAKDSKLRTYASLASGHHSVPFSVKSLGVIGASTMTLFKEVGRCIADREEDLCFSFTENFPCHIPCQQL